MKRQAKSAVVPVRIRRKASRKVSEYLNSGDKSEEELALLAQGGDADAEEYLIRKYKRVVKTKAHLYFMAGADNEDVVQEGMIGIFKAIRSFDPNKLASFRTFAEVCINRQILTAIKQASRLKHSPLNSSISLYKPLSGNETGTLAEILASDSASDPVAMLLLKEVVDYINEKGSEIFSELELRVLREYLQGKTYLEIASETGKTPKTIDNAIQRTKRKIGKYMGGGN